MAKKNKKIVFSQEEIQWQGSPRLAPILVKSIFSVIVVAIFSGLPLLVIYPILSGTSLFDYAIFDINPIHLYISLSIFGVGTLAVLYGAINLKTIRYTITYNNIVMRFGFQTSQIPLDSVKSVVLKGRCLVLYGSKGRIKTFRLYKIKKPNQVSETIQQMIAVAGTIDNR